MKKHNSRYLIPLFMILSFLIGSLLIGCEVDITKAQPLVEKDFGPVSFLHQEKKDSQWFVFWYVHNLDTVVKVNHRGKLFDIVGSEYRTLEIWKQYPRLWNRLIILRKAAGNLKNKVHDTADKKYLNTFEEEWQEW